MGWVADDLWRAACLLLLAALVVVILVRGRRPGAIDGSRPARGVQTWMFVGAALWSAAVLAFVVMTHVDPDLELCSTTTKTQTRQVVTEVSSEKAESTETVKTTAPSSQTTSECGGLGAPMIGLLLIPAALFFVPALTSLDIAGIFKFSFREIEAKVDEQGETVKGIASDVLSIKTTQNTLVTLGLNVNVTQNVGKQAELGEVLLDQGHLERAEDVFAELGVVPTTAAPPLDQPTPTPTPPVSD